ncbi:MAG TPA: hypothetical protein GXZ48_06410 [Acholeplasmataceae bacterium]|jgi:hypothetical protein|nr:hypothetical protein [Acholeplasmataceae bacterium]
MFDELINKSVEILVAFSTGFPSGGAVPNMYKGTLLSCDDDFCKLKLFKSKSNKDIIYIATKFIITIKEI